MCRCDGTLERCVGAWAQMHRMRRECLDPATLPALPIPTPWARQTWAARMMPYTAEAPTVNRLVSGATIFLPAQGTGASTRGALSRWGRDGSASSCSLEQSPVQALCKPCACKPFVCASAHPSAQPTCALRNEQQAAGAALLERRRHVLDKQKVRGRRLLHHPLKLLQTLVGQLACASGGSVAGRARGCAYVGAAAAAGGRARRALERRPAWGTEAAPAAAVPPLPAPHTGVRPLGTRAHRPARSGPSRTRRGRCGHAAPARPPQTRRMPPRWTSPPPPGTGARWARLRAGRGPAMQACLRRAGCTQRQAATAAPATRRVAAHLRSRPAAAPPRTPGAAGRSRWRPGAEAREPPRCPLWCRRLRGGAAAHAGSARHRHGWRPPLQGHDWERQPPGLTGSA